VTARDRSCLLASTSTVRYPAVRLVASYCLSAQLFFSYACAHHRDLHSFPTRRSSDLGEPVLQVEGITKSFGENTVLRGVSFDVEDRESTRLNSSNQIISYAVFCMKKKTMAKHSGGSRAKSPVSCTTSTLCQPHA